MNLNFNKSSLHHVFVLCIFYLSVLMSNSPGAVPVQHSHIPTHFFPCPSALTCRLRRVDCDVLQEQRLFDREKRIAELEAKMSDMASLSSKVAAEAAAARQAAAEAEESSRQQVFVIGSGVGWWF